jgi:hypothetical protein
VGGKSDHLIFKKSPLVRGGTGVHGTLHDGIVG